LKALDPLVSAGLNSSHRIVLNSTVEFWNETFGKLDSLVYPLAVELALRRIQPLVELELPAFPELADDKVRRDDTPTIGEILMKPVSTSTR